VGWVENATRGSVLNVKYRLRAREDRERPGGGEGRGESGAARLGRPIVRSFVQRPRDAGRRGAARRRAGKEEERRIKM